MGGRFLFQKPSHVAQSVGHLTRKSEVMGSIPGLATYFVSPSTDSRVAVVSYWRKYVYEVLVNCLGGLSLPRKSVVRLTDHPDMTLDVYHGRKTTTQQQQQISSKTIPKILDPSCKVDLDFWKLFGNGKFLSFNPRKTVSY